MAREGRRTAWWASATVAMVGLASLAGPGVTPAQAHTTSGISADNASADYTVTGTDGTTIKIRALYPTDTAPQNGWPVVIVKGGTGASRCPDLDFLSRATLAGYGYAVIGMTNRGFPDKNLAGQCTGSSQADDIADSLNDSGSDWTGPNDIQDVKDVVSWAQNQTTIPTDDNNIGFAGFSHDAQLAYLIAKNESRIKAVLTDAGLSIGLKGDNVAQVSNKPTAAWAGLVLGYAGYGLGVGANYDPSTVQNISLWQRSRFLHTTPATSVTTWMNDRTVVDDNSSVDKAHLITTPMFITHGWFDKYINPENAVQAFNKLPTGNKYLYLGSCAGHGNACLANNASFLRGKVHAFFDKYLKGTAGSIGGPIFYAVPPADEIRNSAYGSGPTDNWAVTESTATSFPPSTTNVSLYLHSSGCPSNCVRTIDTVAPTTAETPDNISAPNQTSALDDYCTANFPGGSNDVVTYTSGAISSNSKMVGVDADLYVSSSTDRMQVYAGIYEVDETKPAGQQEIPLWRGSQTVVVPTSYGDTPGTKVRFTFRPSTVAWTWKTGNKIRIKLFSNWRPYFAAEPVPGTYTIHHSSTYPSKFTMKFVA